MITFLTATAAAVSALMAGLLLRPRPGARREPVPVPYGALTVAAMATALVALGFWML